MGNSAQLAAFLIRARRRREAERKRHRERERSKPLWIVKLSGVLDLIRNPEHTRTQLALVDRIYQDLLVRSLAMERRVSIYVDIADVQYFDPCALLLLCAHVSQLANMKLVRVAGNTPLYPVARQAVRAARFVEFLKRYDRYLRHVHGDQHNYIAITTAQAGVPLDTAMWITLHEFLVARGLGGEDAEAAYMAIGECVENVKQHAFDPGSEQRWFAMALPETPYHPACAVVADLGVGIPATVRAFPQLAAAAESIREAQVVLGITCPEDEEFLARMQASDYWCVYYASLGLKTQTGNPERGNGLSGLVKGVRETGRGAVHVSSGMATVTWRGSDEPEPCALPMLRGTVVCLELVSPPALSSGGNPEGEAQDDVHPE
jgi:hypothetical protein